ncbi:MAG TPA: LacI family DNA-binding transcriptional regulator [Acidobacteriaceae bacterium]|nr:LacI family DNA-binding transcriptional regulator [Acidobacteriaceae bacterium]
MSGKKALENERITLRMLANHLGLSLTTVSVVVSDSPAARAIPLATRKRVLAAAHELHYQPNYFAQALRKRRSMSVGVLVPELSEGYFTLVMNGVEEYLLGARYFYFLASHYWQKSLLEQYPRMLMERSVDGILLLNTPMPARVQVPMVSIPGHEALPGGTSIQLNHKQAAHLALEHLADLGHRRIVFMKGQEQTLDTECRWREIMEIAQARGIEIHDDLLIRLTENRWSPDLGYGPVKALLSRTLDFTAIFAFNDTAAIGAIRALHEAGLRVPDDVSVIGFDDIMSSSFGIPSLTTVRQPLREMGKAGAELLLKRINHPKAHHPQQVIMEPELVIRESTASAALRHASSGRRKQAGPIASAGRG